MVYETLGTPCICTRYPPTYLPVLYHSISRSCIQREHARMCDIIQPVCMTLERITRRIRGLRVYGGVRSWAMRRSRCIVVQKSVRYRTLALFHAAAPLRRRTKTAGQNYIFSSVKIPAFRTKIIYFGRSVEAQCYVHNILCVTREIRRTIRML